ncbi:MAG: NAD(P)-dependent oxidoreductase [Candidatus Velthaea sp.]
MIAHLGTGLIGAGFVRAALKRGETVQVWNRTFERAQALEADGAKAYESAADAVRGAERIHITLSDDAAVDEVLESIKDAIGENTLIFDHTTTAPTPTGERYARWAQRQRFFAHVPMFMGPKNALDCTGIMIVSGPAERDARVRPVIEPMTGKLINVGEGDTRAAAFKLFGNMMLVFIVSGLADIYKFAKGMGISTADAHALFSEFKPTGAIDVRGKNMAEGNFAPAWELTMARKDVRLMLEEGALHGVRYDVLPSIAQLFDKGIEAGHGRDDVGAVVAV